MTNSKPHAESILSRLVASCAIFFVQFVTLLLVILVLCSIVPKYAAFFEKWNLEIPAVTQQVMQLSEFCVTFWYLIVFLGVIIQAVVVLLLARAKTRWLLSTYSHLWLLAVVVLLAWIIIVICIPIFGLAEAETLAQCAESGRPACSVGNYGLHSRAGLGCGFEF